MRRTDVTEYLDLLFSPHIAEEGDAAGLQVGPLDETWNAVLVALDLGVEQLASRRPEAFPGLAVIRG